MKKVIISLLAAMLVVFSCGCSDNETTSDTPTEDTFVEITTEIYVEPETEPTEKPSGKTSDKDNTEPAEKTENKSDKSTKPTEKNNNDDKKDEKNEASANPPQANDSDSDIVAQLTAKRWELTTVVVNGSNVAPFKQYGAIIDRTGAYLEFFENRRFQCILGTDGCEGTYTIDSGKVTANIETIFKSTGSVRSNEKTTFTWDKSKGTIKLTLNGVTNVFS